ncbi:LysR family transcriptional regulator [Novosphingobium sp. BL-8H]|uniref:LysR family transcriptional regulator n=1 Tax=Novosphingobium sp. BL-8H TaxID=3127640 RepID=UPI003756A1F8
METAHLKAFLKISEHGSISRAAESLGIAQPSLSQQLLRLEDEIGFSLFERSARGVVLTEAGQVFRERARQILQATEEAIADGRHLRNDLRGQVVLAAPPSLTRLVGARLIGALTAQSASASVRLVDAYGGSIKGWLEAGKIDLGVLYEGQAMRHLSARLLCREELFLVGRPDLLEGLGDGERAPLAVLREHPLALPGMQHGLRQLLEREAEREGFELRVRHEVDSLDVTMSLVEGGAACSVLPWSVVHAGVGTGILRAIRLGGLKRTMVIVRNPSAVLTHASVRVETLLRQTLKEMAAEGTWRGEPIDD